VALAGRPGDPVRSSRLVSFTQRSIAAIQYEVEPVDEPARLILQSELVANEDAARRSAATRGSRPRCAARWRPRSTTHTSSALLVHTHRRSGCGWPRPWTTQSTARAHRRRHRDPPDWARTTVACVLRPERRLRW
jgi:alpha,alpha-trehalose phosphorylase